MDQGWKKRLQDLIAQTPSLSMKSVSLKAGKNAGFLSDLYSPQDPTKPPKDVTVDVFVKLAKAAGVSPVWLLQGDESFHLSIPTIGVVDKGEEWTPTPDAQEAPVDFGLVAHDTVSLEVRGNSMAPAYRDGDFLVCSRFYGPSLDNLIGQDCVVRTLKGQCLLKILRRGSRPGRFNLRSYIPSVDDIEDVQLAWAAPVVWIKRGGR